MYFMFYCKYLSVSVVILSCTIISKCDCQARFWVQVISELRRGVKLKKVEASLSSRTFSCEQRNHPDYKMTPYEILMDDIRERRYHLRKTPPTPSRKDAHAIILEFIRSRPPLKKVRLVFKIQIIKTFICLNFYMLKYLIFMKHL